MSQLYDELSKVWGDRHVTKIVNVNVTTLANVQQYVGEFRYYVEAFRRIYGGGEGVVSSIEDDLVEFNVDLQDSFLFVVEESY